MTKRILLCIFSFLFVAMAVTFAQDEGESSYKENLKLYKYKKHNSEVGVHLGHFFVTGDVATRPGWGAGIHYRRAIDFAFSWRLDATYHNAYGLDPFPANEVATNVFSLAALGYGDPSKTPWFHNYKTDLITVEIDGIYSLNSFNFNQSLKKWNFYVLGGAGINFFDVSYDATNGTAAYDFSQILDNRDPARIKDDRKAVKDAIKDLLDGDYESQGDFLLGRGGDVSDLNDPPTVINAHLAGGAGISRKISDRFNISLEHKMTFVLGKSSDLLDGYRYGSGAGGTDIGHFTNLRLNFAIGKKEDRLPPLYWTSANDLLADDVAATAERVDKSLRDSDGDGIFDMFDQEDNTPDGVAVDTRGVTLDSDKDGVPDYKDKEPHSPPGYAVDADGVAQIPDPGYTTEDDVNRIVDAKLAEFKSSLPIPEVPAWFLPMVNFANNSYTIRRSEYGKMHQVASVLKNNANLRLVVTGYTDRPASECYNQLLSYNRAESAINYLVEKYGISRSRLVLHYGGETDMIIDTSGGSLTNRRVEFRVVKASDGGDMGQPDCGVKKAGTGKKTNYSGNRSGF